MRILMLTQFYPPYIGGEERHVHGLSVQLVERGHSVAVVTLGGADLPVFEVDQGVRVYRLGGTMQRIDWLFSDQGRRHAAPFPDPELTLALRRVVARECPQVVHAHNWMVFSFLPLKRWSGARLVLTVHDQSVLCPKKKMIYHDVLCDGPGLAKCVGCVGDHYGRVKGPPVLLAHWLMRVVEMGAVDMFVPVSRAVAEDNRLVGGGVPVRVIPNFVPDAVGKVVDVPHPVTAQLPDGDFLLFVGALGRYKGIDVLFKAYAGLVDAPPLVVIGYYTSEYPMRTTVLPPNVVVLRDWPHAAVMQAWQRSLLGLVPSTWSEPCPTVAMEAMACGRAVIATRCGGLTDIVVDGETGLLVPPDDDVALRQAMARLLGDAGLRVQMGAAGQRRVVEFQADAVVRRIEQLYDELVVAGSGR